MNNKKLNHYSNEVKILDTTPYIVIQDQIIPEFAITLFDDNRYSISGYRPLYNGVPVLSTIPANNNPANNTADYYFYHQGLGAENRTVYLQAECNINLGPNGLSIPVYLRITNAQSGENLVYQSISGFVGNSGNYYYTSQFEINSSWGDNQLILFEIYFDLTIQDSLPIIFAVGTSGSNEEPIYNIFSDYFSHNLKKERKTKGMGL